MFSKIIETALTCGVTLMVTKLLDAKFGGEQQKVQLEKTVKGVIRFTLYVILPALCAVAPSHKAVLGQFASIEPDVALMLHTAAIVFAVVAFVALIFTALRLLAFVLGDSKEYRLSLKSHQAFAFKCLQVATWVVVFLAEILCVIDGFGIVSAILEKLEFAGASWATLLYLVLIGVSALYYAHLGQEGIKMAKALVFSIKKAGGVVKFVKELRRAYRVRRVGKKLDVSLWYKEGKVFLQKGEQLTQLSMAQIYNLLVLRNVLAVVHSKRK